MAPTVVGYANDGIVENLLPGNARMLFGAEALKRRLHLRLVQPMRDGVIEDLSAARDFARHLRSLIDPPEGAELRAVIGLPANAERAARENLRQAVAGIFDRVIMIPEPFLAALGCRDESRLSDPAYVDPVSNSLFVDIGGGTTDVCLVQGYFPTADDQISLPFAGDKVDVLLSEAIKKTYPDAALSLLKVRDIKEEYSYVGKLEKPIVVNVVVGGKMRSFDVGAQMGECCTELLLRVFEAVKILIARASSDSVTELLQNIILTGGGSRVRGFTTELQRLLTEDGFEKPRVQSVGDDYKEFVARGALKAARQAKESQWQQLIN
jgi:rod shape-determining protein MreB